MSKKIKKLVLALALVCASTSLYAKPYIYLNGVNTNIAQAPIVKNGRTYLPLRATGEVLGAIVDWNSSTKTITISKSYKIVKLRVGEKTARLNNQIVNLDSPAFSVDGVTYVPVRFISDCLGITVDYYSTSGIVSLITDTQHTSEIREELTEVKEVITNITDLTPEQVSKYGKAFVGVGAKNAYTQKPLNEVYIATRSMLPIQIDDHIIYDVWMSSDGSITTKIDRNGYTEGMPIYISDDLGLERHRDPLYKPKIDSSGIMTTLYSQSGLEDWNIMGDDFEKHTFKDLKYVVFNWSGYLLAIPREELLK